MWCDAITLKHKHDLSQIGSISQVQLKQGKRFGAVWFLKQMADRLGISKALGRHYQGTLALLQVCARIITQGSRLSALRMSQAHAVEEVLGLAGLNKDELYDNLTWLAENQEQIETRLWKAGKQSAVPQLFLYDVTSSYLEGMDMGYQWLLRLLGNPHIDPQTIMSAYGKEILSKLLIKEEQVVLMLDQTHINKTFEMLMVSVRSNNRALPLVWAIKATQGLIGFAEQKQLLDSVY